LSYRVVGNEFKLYSVGKDFEDNNGEPIIIETEQMFEGMDILPMMVERMDMSSMPPSPLLPAPTKIKKTVYKDTFYWPAIKTLVKIEPVKQ
jgi:hypothetical protein